MTPTQKQKGRIAIAEFCGLADKWVIVKRGLYYRPNAKGYTGNIDEAWIVSEEEANKRVYPHDEPVTKQRAPVKKYDECLNAMHEAEKCLKKNKPFWNTYRKQLNWLMDYGITATSEERFECFLKSICKWEECQ